MATMDPIFQARLGALAVQDLRRVLKAGEPMPGGRLRRGAHEYINFSANDYLGLSHHPVLRERAAEWAMLYGTGAQASRLVTGTSERHVAIEQKIAAFKGTEAALLFASGWQANAAILPALFAATEGTPMVFTDRLNHASLHHGCQAAGVRQIRFRHNDLDHLAALLAARAGEPGQRFILTESVFSMDGDRADVARLSELTKRHGAFLFLDEAHATGVLGQGGAGLSYGVSGIDCVMGTFSKAMGGFGAYVAGSRALCDYLVNSCSGLIYTTAPPSPVLGAIDAALDLLPTLDAERAYLADLAGELRDRLQAEGFDTGASTTQIVPVLLGSADAALKISAALEADGRIATAIRPPTVPAGQSRLRIALSASHSREDIAGLVTALVRARAAG